MGRTARIGLFLLMGLVVALARLVEIEVGKVRGHDEPATALLIRPPSAVPSSPHHKKTRKVTPVPTAQPQSRTTSTTDATEPPGVEWPRGPLYTVKKGETLGEISQKVLGSSKLWKKLYEANVSRIPNLNGVKPGTRLLVPAREGAVARHD